MTADRIAIILLRLRLEHEQQRARAVKRACRSIVRHVLAGYGAMRLPTGEHQLTLEYRTDQELQNLVDDLLFEISTEAQMWNCHSATEARLQGSGPLGPTRSPGGNISL